MLSPSSSLSRCSPHATIHLQTDCQPKNSPLECWCVLDVVRINWAWRCHRNQLMCTNVCEDKETDWANWAKNGQCESNSAHMLTSAQSSRSSTRWRSTAARRTSSREGEAGRDMPHFRSDRIRVGKRRVEVEVWRSLAVEFSLCRGMCDISVLPILTAAEAPGNSPSGPGWSTSVLDVVRIN